jgi:N-acetylneuraminic acid mutarotase
MKAFSILFMLGSVSAGAWNWQALAPLSQPRAGYGAGVVKNQFVIAGGSYWQNGQKIQTAQTDLFDPAQNRWRVGPPMPRALSSAASATIDGSLFVLGGTEGQRAVRSAYVFDGVRWQERSDLALPEARTNAVAASDGKSLFIIGGIAEPDLYSSELSSAWMINPSQSKTGWSKLPDCSCTRKLILAAAAVGNKLYIFGGAAGTKDGVENLSDIWSLDLTKRDLTKRKWIQEGHLPEPRRAMWAAADGNRILLFGGYTDTFRSDILSFQLRDHQIARMGELPEAIADAKFVRIGTQWYTAGGEVGLKIRGKHTWGGSLTGSSGRHPH